MDEQQTTFGSEPSYVFRELLKDVVSPGAVGTIEQLSERIHEIYDLDQVLDMRLPVEERDQHAEALSNRIRRVVRFLPPHISPMPNEVFSALEFLIYEVQGRPVLLGEAILRLELLAAEIRARPLLHDLVLGRAN